MRSVSGLGVEVVAEQEPGRHAVPSEDGGAGARGGRAASLPGDGAGADPGEGGGRRGSPGSAGAARSG